MRLEQEERFYMSKLSDFIEKTVGGFLRIPGGIRQDFLRELVKKNDLSLRIICMIAIVVELYNIARVLFLSQVRLGTLNNRIYFGAYCLLLTISIIWLLARRWLRTASLETQWRGQYVMILLVFAWHIALNAYDLYRTSETNVAVTTTAVLGLAVFIQSPPLYTLGNFGFGYVLVRVLMAPFMAEGQIINLTITFVVAVAVSLTNAHHASINLLQQQQIIRINDKLQALVGMDPLTELLNKISVEYRTEMYLRGEKPSRGLTFFIIDLDDFKSVNDQYGHPCGDHVLVETASRLRTVFPEEADLGRIGGDEFAVVLNHSLDQAEALAFGVRINQAMSDIHWQGQLVEVQCSVGACACVVSDVTYHDLYVQADQALYLAKQKGKGRCCYFRITAHKTLVAVAKQESV